MSKVSNRDGWNTGLLYGDPAKMGYHDPGPKRTRAPGVVSEWHEQQAVIQWWDMASKGYGLDYRLLFAVPNGAKLGRDPKGRMIEMVMLKKTGLRPGVADLVLAVARKQYHGAYIEMKSESGRASDEQAYFLDLVIAQGYFGRVCNGADEAIEEIKGYLG